MQRLVSLREATEEQKLGTEDAPSSAEAWGQALAAVGDFYPCQSVQLQHMHVVLCYLQRLGVISTTSDD